MLGKLDKLKRLLDVDDSHFALQGLFNKDEVNDIDEVTDTKLQDIEIKKRENKKGVKKINRFEVKSLRNNKDDSIPPPNEFLPSIPFAMYMLGVVKAGKSTFMRSILDLYIEAFDEVIFISPTCRLDPEAISLLDHYPDIKSFVSLSVMEGIMKKLIKLNKGKSPKDKVKTLVIMDDCINELIKFCRKENNFLNRMATNRRHIGLSFILLSQYYKRCPPLLRTNFNSFVLFRQENNAERKKIIEELSGFLGNRYFEELFTIATDKPHSALTINFDASDKIYQYTQNFNTIILTDEDTKHIDMVFN